MLLPYQATVPWPLTDPQQDWIDQVVCIETWLETVVGQKEQEWSWVGNTECACVSFRQHSSAIWFCLRWCR